MSLDNYEKLSKERKKLQEEGKLPGWFETGGYDLFKKSYLYDADNWYEQIKRIADNLSKYAPATIPEAIHKSLGNTWSEIFRSCINNNWIVLATPTLANNGTNRGLSVSCSGQYVGDSIESFYSNLHESAVLSKLGFGTSGYFGDIRHRGSDISSGGSASGVLPVLEDYWIMANKVSQGGVRRGSFGGYVNIGHKDYDEIVSFVKAAPDGKHLGITISREQANCIVNKNNADLVRRFQKLLELRMMGRGYIALSDNIDDQQPESYKKNGLKNHSQGICAEVTLHQDEEHTYSCILASMNATTYDEWKDKGAVFVAQVFMDCMVSDFLEASRKINGMQKIVSHTEKGRAVGLGVTGLHSYMQSNEMVFGDFSSMMFNNAIFTHLRNESDNASKWLAKELGEPLWCEGSGYRNTHRLAQMPNKSSSLIFGQVSEGIQPIVGNVFNQRVSVGEIHRINPNLIKLLKSRNKFDEFVIKSISKNHGSVNHLDFLSDGEKELFRTAFEISQHDILSMAEQRQTRIDQSQSLNLFLPQNATPKYVSELHIRALQSDVLKNLYYVNTMNADAKLYEGCTSCAS